MRPRRASKRQTDHAGNWCAYESATPSGHRLRTRCHSPALSAAPANRGGGSSFVLSARSPSLARHPEDNARKSVCQLLNRILECRQSLCGDPAKWNAKVTTQPQSVRDAERSERSFLSPLSSLLSPRFSGRSGLFGPPLCGGSAPATPPLNPPPHRVYGNMTLTTRCDQACPRVLAHSEYVPAQASQARPLPYMPNVHRHDHREPATQMLTVHSPWADRTQYTHRTWLGSYKQSLQ